MRKYPFTPELLDALPQRVAELLRGLETEVLRRICEGLNASGKLNSTNTELIRLLRSHGIPLKEIEAVISTITGKGSDELNRIFDDAAAFNEKYYGELLNMAALTAPQRLVSYEDIDTIYRQTLGEFRNITRSMGFAVPKRGTQTVVDCKEAYTWALDNAAVQISSGAVSYNEAIRGAVKRLADSGLKTVDYASGHVDSVDVAVRRAVMTGVSQLCDKYTEQAAERIGTHLYEISAHRGARDKGEGWQNHKSWQGKVYSTEDDDKYPSIYEVCGLGKVDGLEGANCRHRRFAFVDGVSQRTYTDEELEKIDPPPFEYEGKEYTAYEATQKQRQIERTVRKLKRERDAYKAAGLDDEARAVNVKIRRLSRKYKEFSAAAGLPEQRERMRAGFGIDITETSRFLPLNDYDGSVSVVGKFSDKQYEVSVNNPIIRGTTKHYLDNLSSRSDRASLTLSEVQNIMNNSQLVLYQTDRKVLKYIADNGYAVLNLEDKVVTAVPEKMRKKYRSYLEGKRNGKES